MNNPTKIFPLGHYEQIINKFIPDNCGIDLEIFGKKSFEKTLTIDLSAKNLLDRNKLKKEINEIVDFIEEEYPLDTRPIWHKINVTDQAINEYLGIGFLNIQTDWLNFVVDYLSIDRAEQSGDTIITLFSINFNWAVCFTLSQDEECLRVEKYDN